MSGEYISRTQLLLQYYSAVDQLAEEGRLVSRQPVVISKVGEEAAARELLTLSYGLS